MLSKKTKNRIMSVTGIMLLGVMLLTGISTAKEAEASSVKAKKVIYLIADGMSDGVLTAARYYKDTQDGVLGNDSLAMDNIRSGFVKTSWANGPITDSAPAGTALSSGYKTNPGYVGVSTENIPYATILEAAELNGLSTGIIATSEIMHATPAAFSSHSVARSNYNNIMKQQVYGDMEVILGGGDIFLGTTGGGKRNDGIDLVSEIKELGYDYVTNRDELNDSTAEKLWGMFAERDLAYDFDREEFNSEEPSLVEMTKKAVEVLEKNEDGFFLMVEGSKIDWAAHANDPAGAIGDILAFDEAVNFAIEYAKENQDTIVVVTTDHANSGFSIGNEDTNPGYDNLTFGESIMQLQGLSLSAEKFTDIISGKSDSEISELITKYYGYSEITSEEIALSKDGKVNEVISKRAKIGYTTGGHTGGDVYLGVYAPAGVSKLRGTVDNTDLPQYIAANLALDLDEASSKLFNDINGVATLQGSTYEINVEDEENPYVLMTKDKVTLKVNINSDVVEVSIDGKENYSKRVAGVTVYNGSTVYGTADEINEIFTNAIEESKVEVPVEPPKEDDEDNDKVEGGTSTKPGNSTSTTVKPNGNLPNTGNIVGSGIVGTIGLGMIGTGGFLFKRKRNK